MNDGKFVETLTAVLINGAFALLALGAVVVGMSTAKRMLPKNHSLQAKLNALSKGDQVFRLARMLAFIAIVGFFVVITIAYS